MYVNIYIPIIYTIKLLWTILEIKEYFDIFDEDKSGKLSRVEISGVVRGLGLNPTKDELEEMFQGIDKDGM